MPIESKEELQKLTIPQLKEKLKQRRLTTSGTKSDLVTRLHDSLQDEENLLSGTTGGGNEELDADALLGSTERGDLAFSATDENILLGIPTTNATTNGDAQQNLVDAKPSAPKNNTSQPIISQEKTTEPNNSEKSSPITNTTDKVAKAEHPPKPERPRISVDDITGVDAKKRRAERFGLNVTTESKPSTATKTENQSEKRPAHMNEKMKERAKRFGLPVNELKDGNGVSSAKIAKVDVDEKIEARKKRFGVS
ncbi:SAP domain-containing protein [Aphelenchoides besseyi]|nr:SAP domain-containing protein [Aphelenchoides besseyi]